MYYSWVRSVTIIIQGPPSNITKCTKKEINHATRSPHSSWTNRKGFSYFCKGSLKKTSLSFIIYSDECKKNFEISLNVQDRSIRKCNYSKNMLLMILGDFWVFPTSTTKQVCLRVLGICSNVKADSVMLKFVFSEPRCFYLLFTKEKEVEYFKQSWIQG